MRRKSTRNVKKASPEKAKAESKTTRKQPSRRRKGSSSKSSDESDAESVHSHVANRSDIDNNSETNDLSESETENNKKGKRLTRRGRSRVSPIKEEPDEEMKGKGKSKSKIKTKLDKSQIVETEIQTNSEISENAQVTAQSPATNDCENVDESIVHVQNVNQSDKEETERVEANDPEEQEKEEVVIEQNVDNAEAKSESDQVNTETVPLPQSTSGDERETNVTSVDQEWSSAYEKQSVSEQQCKTEEKSEIKPEKPDETIESSVKQEQDTKDKPKPSKRVKLIRNSFSIENEAVETEEPKKVEERKRKWGNFNYISTIVNEVPKVDVESLKTVCPTLELANEEDLKLEPVPRRNSRLSTDNEKDHRRESTDRRSEESEKSAVEAEAEEPALVVDKNIIAMNRKISIVDDTASKLKPPPSPAKNEVSAVLFITNLVRPFTLKALRELLERTGKIREDGFWTDKIKSKCIVEYDTKEEAEATRNALHGVHWPIGNGKKLMIEYSTAEELRKALNPPPAPAAVVVPEKPAEKENQEPKLVEKTRTKEEKRHVKSDEHVREWDLGKEHGRGRSRERGRKHGKRSITPADDYSNKKHRKTEESVPQKLMDDLFLKTKATPSIYWQPLSPDEISKKQQQRLVRMEEHKRRMEETSRMPGRDRGRIGNTYRRRYD